MTLAFRRAAVLAVLALCFAIVAPSRDAQERMSDKDLERVMENLKNDSNRFKSSFDKDVDHSTIRKTSQAKDAKQLANNFVKQTQGMYNQFKSSRKADSSLPVVFNSAHQIEALKSQVNFSSETVADWSRIRSELTILSQQFNVSF